MGVTVDECESCKGVWFDRGELAPYLRRIRSIRDQAIPEETHFRLAYSDGTFHCPKCTALEYRTGTFRGIPFSACSSCSGLFLQEPSIKRMFDRSHLNSWAPRKPVTEQSVIDVILDALPFGEYGGFVFLLMYLWPDEWKDDET